MADMDDYREKSRRAKETGDYSYVQSVPHDPRFPNVNQTRNCLQNYIDFHRCTRIYGTDYKPCNYFQFAYKDICPSIWSSIRKCLDLNLLRLSPLNCRTIIRKPDTEPQRVVVEYSSINIAKPMHMGHFRATVLGNFVKNINLAAGNIVTSINYLGDWGTQFGLLSLGFENYGDPDLLESDPLKHLHSVYVRACQTMDSNEGKSAASALATQMESGQRPDLLELWVKFRELSLKELQHLYARMNVHFDHYECESDFVPAAKAMVEQLIKQRIARKEEDGSVSAGSSEPCKRVTLLKGDGGTLYLSRDLAAAVSRFENIGFDRMHYVVEDGQHEHFLNLAHLLSNMGHGWAKPNSSPWPLHVRFARVSGASTRRGNGLFLVDVLDAAKHEARQRMLQSPNTRISPSDGDLFESVSDQMGVTWLIGEMLRRPRMQPVRLYLRFQDDHQPGRTDRSSAQSTTDSRDLTGLGLQYCHARLCSLEEKAMANGLLPSDSDMNSINEMLLEAFNEIPSNRPSREVEEEICSHLAIFPDVLTCAYVKYEADGLLQYCSRLTSLINRAWRFLPVLTAESEELSLSRLAIFRMSRNVLSTCLSIIGAKPLTKL